MPKRIDTQAVLERMQSIYGCDCIPGRTPGLLHQFRELCAALAQEIADREALERRRHGLVIEIEVYRHALAGIRDGSSIPKTIAYRALHAGENAALRLFTLARNEAALRSEEET